MEKPGFKYHIKCTFMKILWSFIDEKISPTPVTGKIVSVQWRGRKVSFWVINYMSPKREKKELNGWWGTEFLGTSILGRIVWKQTEPISLIFNRPETVKSYISMRRKRMKYLHIFFLPCIFLWKRMRFGKLA